MVVAADGTNDGRTVELMMVVLLDPGMTVGRIFAAFRAVSNIRTGCGGALGCDGTAVVEGEEEDDDCDDCDDVS